MNMGKIIGYTQGTFDLFHMGHLRLLKRAKEQCDWLIVGVNTDQLVSEYKNKRPVIPEEDRAAIVGELRCVDQVIITSTLDKTEMHRQLQFNKIFIGDDWKGNDRWKKTEQEMKAVGVELIYIPYTQGISSTIIKQKMDENG